MRSPDELCNLIRMGTSYRERLIRARGHAVLSQSELARRINVKPQAIQHLEDPRKKARGSTHTAAIARECGVSPDWLAEERGPMVLPTGIISRVMAKGEIERAAKEAEAERQTLLNNWDSLPTPLRAYLLRKIVMLKNYADSLSPMVRRFLIPPDEIEEYFEFERGLENEMRKMQEQSKKIIPEKKEQP